MKLLFIKAEAVLRKTVVEDLRQNDHVVEVAVNPTKACERIQLTRYDCVLLNSALPDGTNRRLSQPLLC